VGRALWGGEASSLPTAPNADAALRDAGERLRRRGHYMGGMVRARGEWCWGLDRLGYVERHLGGAPGLPELRPEADWPADPLPLRDGKVELSFYFSFRSPYSYVALERTIALADAYRVPLRIKPVLPMVMRGFQVPLAKRLQLVRDCAREAKRLGVPFGRICDPLGVGVERCLAIFTRAREQGQEIAFTSSAARGIWSEALDVADDDDLAVIVRRAGLDWSEVRTWLGDDSWRATVERHREALRALGLWGVPSFHIAGYATWGQDRLDRVAEQLEAWGR
jgi:2-hydroxychromene-2-carboxylate isomerase